jgi:hypothetical protein
MHRILVTKGVIKMIDTIYLLAVIVVGLLAFFIGKKFSKSKSTESKTTTFLIKSIQAIAELAVLEYVTEGVTDIKEKKTNLFSVRWKRGLLRYTAKIKVGFDIDRLDHAFDHLQKVIRIILPEPRVLSCEIYNRKFYKLPLEKAENVPWKFDIIEDFSSDEVLALDDEARANALKNVNEFYVLDLLQDKTKLAFKKIFSLSYPEYSTEVLIANKQDQKEQHKLPGQATSNTQVSDAEQ